MKKIIMVLLLIKGLAFSNDIYLKDFVNIISTSLNITIVIDNEVNNQLSIYVSEDLTNKSYLKILSEILTANDLTIKSFNNFYLITRVKKDEEQIIKVEPKKLRTIQLYNIDYEYIKPMFLIYKELEHSYITSSKILVIKSVLEEFEVLKRLINSVDVLPSQLKLKITILDTNIEKIKEYGTELTQSMNLGSSSNFFFNLLAFPFSVNSSVNSSQSNNLNSYIKLLNQNSITELVASPTLTLLDNKKVVFEIVKNIPYLSGSTTVEDSNTSTTSSYTYKDIGLKITITPRILNDNIYLDLILVNESILDNSDTPTTSKSNITQSFRMTKNKLFVLTGINQKQKFQDLNETPFLSDIPVLGWLFKTDSDTYTNSNLTVLFELVDDDKSNDFKIITPSSLRQNISLEHQKRVNEILGYRK